MTTINIDLHLLRAAIKALNITAPIYSATYTNDGSNGDPVTVAIQTRDGVLIWSPGADQPFLDTDPAVSDKQPVRVVDDLTLIPQIGAATERLLNQHGIYTFEDLSKADTDLLLSVMPRRALRCVTLYLRHHHPELLAPSPKE